MSPILLEALIVAGIKYGPDAVASIIALFKKETATLADVETLFATIKPYEAYGIPDQIPAKQ